VPEFPVHVFVFTVTALFPLLNPIDIAPVFIDMTRRFSPPRRRRIALLVSIYSFVLLVGALLVGSLVLHAFELSIPPVQIAGGLVVFHAAWRMLNAEPKLEDEAEATAEARESDIAFFPLTVPLTADPGSLAIAIALSGLLKQKTVEATVMYYSAAIAGLLVLTGFIYLTYRYAHQIFARLGPAGTTVVTKLFAFLLLAVGVNIVWDGLRELILHMHDTVQTVPLLN
jgi:multiple antibiotic resistance protein